MIALPASMRVFERGWLSSNNVFFIDATHAALVDSGYATHAPQTNDRTQPKRSRLSAIDLSSNGQAQAAEFC